MAPVVISTAETTEEEKISPPVEPVDKSKVMSREMRTATSREDLAAVKELVAGGEDVNCVDVDIDKATPIMKFLSTGASLHNVKALAEMGADLTYLISGEGNALHAAAFGGNVDHIDWLLDNTDIDVNTATMYGVTPLAISLRKGLYPFSTHLVANGADDRTAINVKKRQAAERLAAVVDESFLSVYMYHIIGLTAFVCSFVGVLNANRIWLFGPLINR
jgi:hypothetical protein